MAIGVPRWCLWTELADYANHPSGNPDNGNRPNIDLYETIGVEHNDDGTHKTSGFLISEIYSYVGNGADDRNISLQNANIDIIFILIFKEDGEYPVFKSIDMVGDSAKQLGTNAFQTNMIQSITTTGQFQVGSDDATNKNGDTYHYLIWGII